MEKFLVKVIANGIVVTAMVLWFSEATFWGALMAALVLTVIAYLIGDQLILRASNNTVATLADGVLAFVYLWVVADFMDWSLTMGEILATTIVLAVVEAIYHRYLTKNRTSMAR